MPQTMQRISQIETLINLADNFQDLIYRIRLSTPRRIEYVNPAILNITGYSVEEAYTGFEMIDRLIHPEDAHYLEEALANRPCSLPVIIRLMKKDGQQVWTEHNLTRIVDDYGQGVIIDGVARIISEQNDKTSLVRKNGSFVHYMINVGKALTNSINLNQMSEIICKGIKEISGADHCIVLKYESNNQLSCLWPNGYTEEQVSALIHHTKNILDVNVRTTLQVFDRFRSERIFKTEYSTLDEIDEYQSILTCPLTYEGRFLALIICGHNEPHQWDEPEKAAVVSLSRPAAVALENSRLFEELEESYLQSVISLARALDARDAYTADHCQRLMDQVNSVARNMGCTDNEVQNIRWAALLHDIGKIGIPDEILHKPGKFTLEEFQIMKHHAVIGAEIIQPIKRLEEVTPIIRCHHEKFDGSGYPDGLKGEEIPLAGRILSVADAYLAMTDYRVYRQSLPPDEAVYELQNCSGTQFDPKVVEVFIHGLNRSLSLS